MSLDTGNHFREEPFAKGSDFDRFLTQHGQTSSVGWTCLFREGLRFWSFFGPVKLNAPLKSTQRPPWSLIGAIPSRALFGNISSHFGGYVEPCRGYVTKTDQDLSPSRRAQIFGVFLPENRFQRLHGTTYREVPKMEAKMQETTWFSHTWGVFWQGPNQEEIYNWNGSLSLSYAVAGQWKVWCMLWELIRASSNKLKLTNSNWIQSSKFKFKVVFELEKG